MEEGPLGLCRLQGQVEDVSTTQDAAAPQEPPAEAAGGLEPHAARLCVAASHTPRPPHGAQQACWRVQVKPRVLHRVAVAGEPIGAGAYPMPNKGVQATPSSVRCAPASGRA